MPSINFDKKIIYVHFHKTSGCFIQDLLSSDFDFIMCNFLSCDDINVYANKHVGIYRNFLKLSYLVTIKPEEIKDYYFFTFVRNPYTRFISGWNYIKGKYNSPLLETLSGTIDNKDIINPVSYAHIFLSQYDMSRDEEGNINMNFIGKFENLIEDLTIVLSKFYENPIIEDKKVNENPIKYGNYRQYYTPEILSFVNEWFSKDFEMFGYNKVETIEELN